MNLGPRQNQMPSNKNRTNGKSREMSPITESYFLTSQVPTPKTQTKRTIRTKTHIVQKFGGVGGGTKTHCLESSEIQTKKKESSEIIKQQIYAVDPQK